MKDSMLGWILFWSLVSILLGFILGCIFMFKTIEILYTADKTKLDNLFIESTDHGNSN